MLALNRKKRAAPQPKFMILGDSHGNVLSWTAQEMELDYVGGAITAGRFLNKKFIRLADDNVMHIEPERNTGSIKNIKLDDPDKLPILSTVGFNSTNFVHHERWGKTKRFMNPDKKLVQHFSRSCIKECVRSFSEGSIEFYKTLCDNGFTVAASYSPQRFPPSFPKEKIEACKLYEELLVEILSSVGVHIVDIRDEVTNNKGFLKKEYRRDHPGDHAHGNSEYGRKQIEKFFEIISS